MPLVVSATFTRNSGQPATGLALADIDMFLTSQNRTTGADAVVWDGTQNPTEEIDNVGAYARILAVPDFVTNVYYARATYTGAVVLDVDDVTGIVDGLVDVLQIEGVDATDQIGTTVWTFAARTLTSFGTLIADIWSFGTRTLTQAAASVIAAITGDVITQVRATTWSIPLTGLGSLVGRTALYFTVKRSTADADADALVMIEETAGLEVINAETATVPGNGSLVVDDAVAGDVTITLAAVESLKLSEEAMFYYEVKMVTAANVSQLTTSRFNVEAVVTEAIT